MQANAASIGNFKNLLLEFLVAHKLLDCSEVPAVEEGLLVVLNVCQAERFDECEVIAINFVLYSRHGDDYFEIAVV